MSSQQCSEDEKEVLVELIEALKVNRCLWDSKCEAYSNRDLRSVAHGLLLDIFRKIQPNATVDLLKKKIENLKCSFRREFRKVKASETTWAATNHIRVYTPRLWFYELMTFLEEKELVREGLDTLEENDDDSLVDNVETTAALAISEVRARSEKNSSDPPSALSVCGTPIPRKRKISAFKKKKEAMLGAVQNLLSAIEPEWEVIGKSLGLQLSQLNNDQQTIAQKLISDVIFYGKRLKLTDFSFINVCPPSATHTFQSQIPRFSNSIYDHHAFQHSTYNFPTQSSHTLTSPSPPAISPSMLSSIHSDSNA